MLHSLTAAIFQLLLERVRWFLFDFDITDYTCDENARLTQTFIEVPTIRHLFNLGYNDVTKLRVAKEFMLVSCPLYREIFFGKIAVYNG